MRAGYMSGLGQGSWWDVFGITYAQGEVNAAARQAEQQAVVARSSDTAPDPWYCSLPNWMLSQSVVDACRYAGVVTYPPAAPAWPRPAATLDEQIARVTEETRERQRAEAERQAGLYPPPIEPQEPDETPWGLYLGLGLVLLIAR